MNNTTTRDVMAAASDLLDLRCCPALYEEFFQRLRDEEARRTPWPANSGGPISRLHHHRSRRDANELNKRQTEEAMIVGADLTWIVGGTAQDGYNAVRKVLDSRWRLRLLRDYAERARARDYYDKAAKERVTEDGSKHGNKGAENSPPLEKSKARDAAGKAVGVSDRSKPAPVVMPSITFHRATR